MTWQACALPDDDSESQLELRLENGPAALPEFAVVIA